MASRVLAFDTCFGALSVAVGEVDDGRVRLLSQIHEEIGSGHAERLIPAIDSVMREARVAFGDLTRIAVTLGPGTFTGVRTGVAAARALRLASGLEVVGVSSLQAIAEGALLEIGDRREGRPLIVAADARRGRLYVQVFAGAAREPAGLPIECDAEQAPGLVAENPFIATGSGARALAAAGSQHGKAIEIQADRNEPRAADLISLCAQSSPLRDILPVYIRAPDAKPQADKRLRRAT